MLTLNDLNYSVCETNRGSSGASRQDDEKVSQTASVSYLVIIESDKVGGGSVDPEDVSTELVRNMPELPKVNGDSYYHSGFSNPYLICSNKTVTRDLKNRLVFTVDVQYVSQEPSEGEKGQTQEPPASLDDISPTVSAQITSKEVPIYEDKKGNQCWSLPTGTPFESPVVETIPVLTLTITQYEPSITFEQMMGRSYKINSDTYRNRGAGSWMTGPVKASTVKVQLASGPVFAAKVVYTVTLSEATFIAAYTGEPEGAVEGQPYFYGWDQTKPLVDFFSMSTGSTESWRQPKTSNDENGEGTGEPTTCYIYADSGIERRPDLPGEGLDRPSYLTFQSQDEISFSFLKA